MTFRSILRQPELRRLYLASTLSEGGTKFGDIALAFASLAAGGTKLLGILLAGRTVSAVVFLVIGGYLADRLRQNRLMAGADALCLMVQASTALVFVVAPHQLFVLLVLQLFYGLGEAAFVPASKALLPRLIDPERLHEGYALFSVTKNTSRIVAPAMAGLVVSLTTPITGLLVDAGSFLASAALVAGLPVAAPEAAQASMWTELRRGASYVIRQRWLLGLIGISALFQMAFTAPVAVDGPLVATRLGGAVAWGAVLTTYAAGALAGGFVAGRIRPRRAMLSLSVALLANVPYVLALSGPAPVALVAAAALLAGVAASILGTVYITYLQGQVPQQLFGRVLSIDTAASLAALPVGQLLVGVVAGSSGSRAVFLASVGVSVLLSIMLAVMRSPAPAAARMAEAG